MNQTPSWLGLPNNAEKVLLTTKGSEMTTKLLKMQSLSDDDEFTVSTASLRSVVMSVQRATVVAIVIKQRKKKAMGGHLG